jgi:hypothetical protein
MRSVKGTAHHYGKLGRAMLPVFLVCAAITTALVVGNLLSKAGAEPQSIATDDRGFINTAARCDPPTFAVAVGRTQQSLVAICNDGRGNYGYRGVRLKDNSALNLPATKTADGKFTVKNANFIYMFSAKELMIIQGWGWVLRKEPMVAYVQPRLPPGAN